MWGYEPPVSTLLTLGKPIRGQICNYSKYGIYRQHVDELIRLMRDPTPLRAGKEPDVFGQVHAWRALAYLRAEEAILPMLELLAENAALDPDEWDDWSAEELPIMIGVIGPTAIPITVQRLNERHPRQEVTGQYASALTEIAKHNPEVRSEVITHLSRILESAKNELPHVNGFVIAHLLDLKAIEAMPVIEKAFATGNVDERITGDLADVKSILYLGPAPVRSRPWGRLLNGDAVVHSTLPTAKARADARAKQRKAEKRRLKKMRQKKPR